MTSTQTASLLAFTVAALLIPRGPARAGDAVEPLASHVIDTDRRTLRGLPTKGVVTDADGWAWLTEGLIDPPPPPDFAKGQVALVVVADTTGGIETELASLERTDGAIRALLVRHDEETASDALTRVRCFVAVLDDWGGGVELVHRTQLEGGIGTIERVTPAVPSDRERRLLPRLGADLRLSVAMEDGSPLPEGVMLRIEVHYGRKDLPGKVLEVPFPKEGLIYSSFENGARYVYAAHRPGLRSRNALVLRKLPRSDATGSPRPTEHRFLLEPVPGGRRP